MKTRKRARASVITLVLLALVSSVALAAVYQLSIPSGVVKVDTALSSTSDLVGVYFDEQLTQPATAINFGEISDRGCSTRAPTLFIKNLRELEVSNIFPDVPLPVAGFEGRPYFEPHFVAQRSDKSPYDGGVLAPGEVITMQVWICDLEGWLLPPTPKTYDDVELRINSEVAAPAQ